MTKPKKILAGLMAVALVSLTFGYPAHAQTVGEGNNNTGTNNQQLTDNNSNNNTSTNNGQTGNNDNTNNTSTGTTTPGSTGGSGNTSTSTPGTSTSTPTTGTDNNNGSGTSTSTPGNTGTTTPETGTSTPGTSTSTPGTSTSTPGTGTTTPNTSTSTPGTSTSTPGTSMSTPGTSTSTPGTSTSTPGTSTSTPGHNLNDMDVFGWLLIPRSIFTWFASTTPELFPPSTSTPGSSTTTPNTNSPFVYVNGYPTLNGNYVDCYGNIDNDMGHHTTNPADTDPAHHSGQNCPGGQPQIPSWYSQNPGGNMNMPDPTHGGMMSWPAGGQNWIMIPLTIRVFHQLQNMF